jgi:hypothetical protein
MEIAPEVETAIATTTDPSPVASNPWPLAVHIVYQHAPQAPGSTTVKNETASFAETLTAGLCGGERSGKVPVRLWRGGRVAGTFRPPALVPLERAAKNLVVIVVDQNLFTERIEWEPYISALLARRNRERDLILPIASGANAAKVAGGLKDVNHIPVLDPASLAKDEHVLQAVYAALLRHLIGKVPRIFLCHAKADGEKIAQNVRGYLEKWTQLRSFFDRHDIPLGEDVTKSIQDAIRQSLLFVVWTDGLLDSPWCQYEIIEARRQQRPMLVLDALTMQSPRFFPFLGNMPVVHWRNKPAPVVTALLLELICAFHLKAVFESLNRADEPVPYFGLHPPDLLDASLARSSLTTVTAYGGEPTGSAVEFVYPDPPLKLEELAILKQLIPSNRFLTLAEWHALRAGNVLRASWDVSTEVRPNPLRAMSVGISVSESETWADLGLIGRHQDDLAADIALELILLGAKVFWGGDLRPEGLGFRLKRIVETYQHPTHPPQDHVALFTPFSLRPKLPPRAIKDRRDFADVRLMDCPVKLQKGRAANIGADTPSGRALMALALSAMRAAMAHECHARILLGGRLHGFQGIYPGIVEEAFESVRADRPLYILGGFGGAARAVFDAIANPQAAGASELADACQEFAAEAKRTVHEEHRLWVVRAQRADLQFDPQAVTAAFSGLGRSGLSRSNGLSDRENEVLSTSQDSHAIVGLLVKGLAAVAQRKSIPPDRQ